VDAVLANHPHLLYGEGRHRGSVLFTLDARRLQADLRAVDLPADPASPVRSLARFSVEAGLGRIERA
jgi:hypothetical protein